MSQQLTRNSTGKNGSSRKNGRGDYPRVEIDVRYGKTPPQVIDLEQAVLGAIMLEKSAFDTVIEILKPECFYLGKHQSLFSAMMQLSAKSMPVDILTVVQQLKATGELETVGGPFYVTKLTNDVVSAASVEAHSRIILQKFIQRELIRLSGEIINEAYEEASDVFDLMDRAENRLFAIATGHLKSNYSPISSLYVKNIRKIEELMRRGEDITGVTSGYRSLDVITAGWQPTDLIILAARPSVGKSAFAFNLARNAALDKLHPVGVGIFSLEMSADQVVQRLIGMESDYHLDRIRRGKFEPESFHELDRKCRDTIAKAPIFIDDTAAINIFELLAKARRMVAKNKVGLIIVDYLQLMSGTSDNRNTNREQEISKIARDLKGLAKELKVPVIALSQLSRKVEERKGGEPQLSDLRECLPVDEWIYTPDGAACLRSKPKQVVTLSRSGVINSNCMFIEKTYNTIYLVKSQYGQFRATANHLLLTGTGWKKVNDLTPGRDVIASPKAISHANKGSQPHARLLGWLIGNGGLSGTPSLIYRKELDESVKKEIASFGVRVQYRKTQKSDNVLDTYLSNGVESGSKPNPIMLWIRHLGLEGLSCYDKYIPKDYLGSSNETHKLLLKGLWESDGTVTRGVAKYSTVSEVLARQIGWLLLTIGVRSTLNKYKNIWQISCSTSDNENMKEIVDTPCRFGKLKMPNKNYIDPSPSIFVELAHELSFGYETSKKRKRIKIHFKRKNEKTIKDMPNFDD